MHYRASERTRRAITYDSSSCRSCTCFVCCCRHSGGKFADACDRDRHDTRTYQSLYDLVKGLKPDFVGVEMRQEDLPRDPQYLASMYPKEMIEVAKEYGPRAFGFDWLGDDVAGRQVPDDWWPKKSPIKALEREADADPKFSHDSQLGAISAQENQILANATAASLNDGRYDRLNDAYYARMAALYAGTKYDVLPRFYA